MAENIKEVYFTADEDEDEATRNIEEEKLDDLDEDELDNVSFVLNFDFIIALQLTAVSSIFSLVYFDCARSGSENENMDGRKQRVFGETERLASALLFLFPVY